MRKDNILGGIPHGYTLSNAFWSHLELRLCVVNCRSAWAQFKVSQNYAEITSNIYMDPIWALHRNPDQQGRACMMHVMMMWVQKLCGVYLHSWHQSCMLLSVPTLTLGHNLTCSPGVLLCIHLTAQISHFFNRFAFIYTQICSQCNQISSWEKEFYIYFPTSSLLHI